MNKGKKQGKLIMLLGTALILSAMIMALRNSYAEKRAEVFVADVLSHIDITPSAEKTQTTPDYVINPLMELPRKEIDGNFYVGTISVPGLDVTFPVMEQWNYDSLEISPCVYEGTPYLGNFIICAHNYRSLFGFLENLSPGDKITFTDFDYNVFNYEVMYTELLDNNAVAEMSMGDWDMTLFTCTYDIERRVTVRCKIAEAK